MDTLQIKKVDQALQDAKNQDLDEIYIDLRGQLHHKGEEETAKPTASAAAEQAPADDTSRVQQPPQNPAGPGAPKEQ